MRRRLTPFVALAMLLALPAAAHAQQRTISVAGNATLTARNDTARVGFGVAAERRTRRAALDASSRRTRRVIAALRSLGIAARDIRTGAITVFSFRRGKKRKRRIYRVRQGVTATVRDADKAGDVVSRGVGAGAGSVNGPRYFVSDPKALARRALTAAFLDARAKAADLARAAGLQLGRALSIRESTFQDANENAASPDTVTNQGGDGGAREEPAPTSPGNTAVDGVVNVVFEAR